MKKKASFLLALTVLLTGCTAQEPTEYIQSQYDKVASAEMEAEVTLHLPEENRTFTIACRYAAQGETTITILAPEELQGVTAVVEGEELTVSYEDMMLPAGTLDTVCPANVLPFLLRQLAGGYVMAWGEENREGVDCCCLTLEDEHNRSTVWIEKSSLLPRFASIAGTDGKEVLSVRMLTFDCTTAKESTEG